MLHFFCDPRSNALFHEPLRERHKIHFLFTHCELRGVTLRQSWKERPLVTSIDELKGADNRVFAYGAIATIIFVRVIRRFAFKSQAP
jgi:hypothetical protein